MPPAHLRHPYVAEDQIERLAAVEERERLRTAARGLDLLALELQHLAEHVEVVQLVVHDEDAAAAPLLRHNHGRFPPRQRGERKRERQDGALAAPALGLQRSAQARHHAPGHREPERALSGDAREGIEQAREVFLVHSLAGVADGDYDAAAILTRPDADRASVGHLLARVQQQASEDVRQLSGGSAHQRQGRHVGLDPHPGGIGLRPGHLQRSGEDGGEVERIAGAVAPPASEVL